MQKIELLVGIPASGKSTYARDLVTRNPDWVRVNNDDIRTMLFGANTWTAENEKLVKETRMHLIAQAIKRGKSVVVDNLNLSRRLFDEIVTLARHTTRAVLVYEKPFYIELNDALARDAGRGPACVGETVIRDYWKKSGGASHKHYKPRIETILPTPSVAVTQDPTLPRAIVCDLDGTLALLNGRNPYDATGCENDEPNMPVVETVKLFKAAGYRIVFCSGREDKHREASQTFIEAWTGLPRGGYDLHMRPTGDSRKDAIFKNEVYERGIAPKYNVLFVLDDRDQVVEFWRGLGLACFQVAYGDF